MRLAFCPVPWCRGPIGRLNLQASSSRGTQSHRFLQRWCTHSEDMGSCILHGEGSRISRRRSPVGYPLILQSRSSRILEGKRTQIGGGVAHGFWWLDERAGAL